VLPRVSVNDIANSFQRGVVLLPSEIDGGMIKTKAISRDSVRHTRTRTRETISMNNVASCQSQFQKSFYLVLRGEFLYEKILLKYSSFS
jgi:hypothetical protein